MATLRITNLTTDPVYLNDIYATIAPSNAVYPLVPYVDVSRAPAEVSAMQGLLDAVAAGTLSVAVTYTADELAAKNLVGGQLASLLVPGSVPAPVAAAATVGSLISLRVPVAALGGAGTLIDTIVYAVNTLPYKLRIVDAYALVATAGPGSSVFAVRSAASGGGTLAASIPSDATGRVSMTTTATSVLTPGASVGLFVRRDRSTVGEIYLTARIES